MQEKEEVKPAEAATDERLAQEGDKAEPGAQPEEKALAAKASRRLARSVFAITAVLVGVVVIIERDPGRLAVLLGFLLAAVSVLCVAVRKVIFAGLSISDADAELSVVETLQILVIGSLGLVLLGFLQLFFVQLLRLVPSR